MNDLNNYSYQISVCIPMYNASAYLRECIDSILCQTFSDFELLIVDDGSTDESRDIVRSYNDPRIRLIENNHNYIGSLNLLMDKANGKYIARMDADDIMLPDRLEVQYTYMEAYPETDILGCGMYYLGEPDKLCATNGVVTANDLLRGNYIANPTVMMRRDSIREAKIQYDEKFIYAEDYHFWAQAAMAGLHITNWDKPVLKYRFSTGQVSSVHSFEQFQKTEEIQNVLSRWLARDEALWAETHPCKIPDTLNKLTIIIPFLNEQEEVGNTVRGIRDTAGENVDIIVINDQSNDGYDYRKDLLPYNVSYLYNKERKGVAASRDYGVSLCKTPFFLLLDAHMRFYDTLWVDRIISMLEKDDRCLLCCQTKFLYRDKETGCLILPEESPKTYGAYSPFKAGSDWPDILWNFMEFHPNECNEEIAVVLGAGYAASKRYWTYLRGLDGLQFYGSDESYISYKVWLEGGKCILLKDVVIGHIYRTSAPYKISNKDSIYNQLLIARLIFPQSFFCQTLTYSYGNNKRTVFNVLELLSKKDKWIEDTRKYYKSIFTKDIKFLLQLNYKYRNVVLIEETIRHIPEIYVKVSEQLPNGYGLFDGKAGCVLWLCHYGRFTHKSDEKIKLWWKDIEDNVRQNKLSWEFDSGVSGIGWCALYLWINGMIDEYPDSLIDHIDNQLAQINPLIYKDVSLETGLSGILAYLCVRLKFKALKWPDSLLAQWHKISLNIIDSSNDLTLLYYAFLFNDIYKNGYDEENQKPSIVIWMNTSLFIPKNADYWDISLYNGVLASSLSAMLINEFTTK